MARLYADEQFPLPVVELLRDYGHDVLTVQESGNSGFADSEVLLYAIRVERAVLTINRRDYKILHQVAPEHFGIIACSEDLNFQRFADRIHAAILQEQELIKKWIRVTRPT